MKNFIIYIAIVLALFVSFLGKANAATVNIVMGMRTYTNTTSTDGYVTSITFSIPIKITVTGQTLYLPKTVKMGTVATGESAIVFSMQGSINPAFDDTTQDVTATLSTSDAVLESKGYRLDDSATKHFTLEITMNSSTSSTSWRVSLKQIRLFTEGNLINGTNYDLLPQTDFKTDFRFINAENVGVTDAVVNDFIKISFCPEGVRILSGKSGTIEIYSFSGTQIYSGAYSEGEAKIFSFTAGVYIISLQRGREKSAKSVVVH